MNNYAKVLIQYQQLSYQPRYYLKPIELETLKTYIETNLANNFIRLSKAAANGPNLFLKKLDGSL